MTRGHDIKWQTFEVLKELLQLMQCDLRHVAKQVCLITNMYTVQDTLVIKL